MVDAVETIEDNAIYYKGTGEGYNGDLTVKVGIENDIITTIKVIDHQEDYEWYSKAKKPIIDAIIEAQSTEVDVVSGATYSSLGIIEAVENAMKKIQE